MPGKGKKDFDKAIADYDEAIRLNPKAAMAHCGRALAWRGKQDLDKAIADYDEAVRIDPRPYVYVSRGHVWRAKKEYDRALADFRKASEIGPNDPFAANGLAWFLATCPSAYAHRDGKRWPRAGHEGLRTQRPAQRHMLRYVGRRLCGSRRLYQCGKD